MAEVQSPIVCGHRGARAHAPENTIEAFTRAGELGATWIEFDVRPCAGGELVVHHDPVTTDGRIIAQTEAIALASAPSLDDLLTWNAERELPLGLDIELKTDGIELSVRDYVDAAIASIERRRPTVCLVTSFDLDALTMLKRSCPDLATGLLYDEAERSPAIIERACSERHQAIVPNHRFVDRALVSQAHALGLTVSTWTVNERIDAVRVIEAGVDMVIGDDPSVLVAAVAELS